MNVILILFVFFAIKDFRATSLAISVYKIHGEVLSLWLGQVLDELVSGNRIAYVMISWTCH